jgi:hypothetical protein
MAVVSSKGKGISMDGWIPVVVIIFAMTLVVGPVMWLKPSQRDQRLASLRQRAAKAGLNVQMLPLPAAAGEGTAAVYFARWQNPRRLRTGWTLELQRMAHEMHFSGYWDWRNGRAATETAWPLLRNLLQQLPADATAVICSESGLGVQWRETSGDAGMAALEKALTDSRPLIEEAIRQPQRSGETAP